MSSNLITVARIYTPFSQKFGIPRQSGLVGSVISEIRFEREFKCAEAVKGIEDFSHLWLLWGFSEAKRSTISLTVAPPRLGGNKRKGVFATRSPYRPNSIGLSCVKLEEVKVRKNGEPVLIVSGADILNGSPIYDIKPYLPYTDCRQNAYGGFAEEYKDKVIAVDFPDSLMQKLPTDIRQTVFDILAQDPRAAYNKKPDYIYGMNFSDFDIRFTVSGGVLTVVGVEKSSANKIK